MTTEPITACRLCGAALTTAKINVNSRYCDTCMDKRLGVVVRHDVATVHQVGWQYLCNGCFRKLPHLPGHA